MAAAPAVAVVVVSYNTRAVIGDLLASLPGAFGGVPYTVIVVDNGSTDGSVESLAGRNDLCLIRSANRGYAAGINRGLAAAPQASAYLVLNPDTRLHPGAAAAMLAAMRRPGAGIVVPRVLTEDGSLDRSLRRAPTIPRAMGLTRTGVAAFSENVMEEASYTEGRVVDWAVGAVMLVSAQCYRAVGPWDESYFLYSEETDFCIRARDAGFTTWYEPTAVVTHIGGASGTSMATQTLRAMNSVRFYHRRHSRTATFGYFLLTLLREVLWGVKRRDLTVARCMLRPSLRPVELHCNDRLLPR